jgi:streptogramin lyase
VEEKTDKKVHLGNGILKPGVRPIRVIVDDQGEYWLCDESVDPAKDDIKKVCTAHGSIHMAEGG